MKRILLLLTLLASLFVVTACGSSKDPMVSDPDGVYVEIKEGNYTYKVTRKKIYEVLKEQVGYSLLKDLIDTELLKNEKNSSGKSYWNLVTDEEIEKELENDIFPSGTEGLTEDEINEARKKYFDKMFEEYGLTTEEEVKEYYRLNFAKEKYAKDKLIASLDEKDFTDSDYETYFKNNYKDEYYAIVVSFDTEKKLLTALEQLGYKFNTDKTLAFADGTPLNKEQVIKMFIDLYNLANIPNVEDYPTNTLVLKEGKHYKYENGKIVFNIDELDILHYTNSEISNYQSEIATALSEFVSYNEGDNFYTKTPRTYKNGARYSMYMKIGQVSYKFEDVKAEIREKLINQRLTSVYINTEMGKLRAKYNIVFFDSEFNKEYTSDAKYYGFEYSNKKTSKELIAKTDLKEYTADDLFKVMNRNYGISASISEIEFNRFVDNLDFNKIYDFKNKKVLNEDKWETILDAIKDEKKNFKQNLYEADGYPKSIGWKNYIKAVYGVENETELQKYFVYQDVKDAYSKSLGALEGLDENSTLWKFYHQQMEKMVEEYFKVTGVHLLITVYDKNGNPIDPSEWTATQVEYAKEFYNQVMDYLNNETYTDSATKKLQNLQAAFDRAPYFVPGLPQNTESQPAISGLSYVYNGIEISKFKSAGLSATFQDLGTFTNGKMVKEFNDAAKMIWDANNNSSDTVIYGNVKKEDGSYTYLVTQFGYHVYVNTKTYPIEEYATGKILPTIEDAIEYIKDNNSTKLSTKLKNSLSTYFKPVYSELTSTTYLQYTTYKQLRGLNYTFKHDDYTIEDFNRFLDLTIAKKLDSLTYSK